MWLIKIIIITILKKDFVLFIEKAEAFPLKSCSQVDIQYAFPLLSNNIVSFCALAAPDLLRRVMIYIVYTHHHTI